jgi:hypothetical protein
MLGGLGLCVLPGDTLPAKARRCAAPTSLHVCGSWRSASVLHNLQASCPVYLRLAHTNTCISTGAWRPPCHLGLCLDPLREDLDFQQHFLHP